jgi:acetyltransferase-like isoleucine patch superfamily enzyme
MTLFSFVFKATRKLFILVRKSFEKIYTYIILKGNGVKFNRSLICNGVPEISVHNSATFFIGNKCTINTGLKFNPIGRYTPSFFMVRENAVLKIGNHVGISSTAIICHKEIIIDDNVKIGGGVCIYDTDFHSIDPLLRQDAIKDKEFKISMPVRIKKNVFIGAHATILKGVTIGENSIVGACSVVTKDIPTNEIWAGNPARFLKKIT